MDNEEGLDLEDSQKQFLLSPRIVENYDLLKEIGVFDFINTLNNEIRNYKTLLNRGLDIFNRTNIDEIIQAMVWQISDHFFPSFIAFLWKPIQNRPDITIRAYRNYKPVDLGLKIDTLAPLESFFYSFPKPINFNALEKELKDNQVINAIRPEEPEIVIPILGPFGLYGIILVGRKTLETEYAKEELVFLQQLMSFVSQAIKNHLHYEHSLRDVKTGLYNHGFFMTRMKEEVNRTKRSASVFSVIVMDVDKFKNFNDTYGHLAGDQVLERLAQVIRQNVRTDDIPSRFGGEEFTVLLPHTEIGTAWMVAERLRTSVASMIVPWDIALPQVTISLGVYAFDRSTVLETTDILRRADEALYISKAKGRNCSTVWEPGLIGGIS
ncbi:MAG: GGDEF domain-containing protein [Treponema sp.]|jgi:diguanylate cyclase (GGDEF)-like protein|nr:GGDEF domain-containing protein [Treponema sp.]